jgi:hypothetical protein
MKGYERNTTVRIKIYRYKRKRQREKRAKRNEDTKAMISR